MFIYISFESNYDSPNNCSLTWPRDLRYVWFMSCRALPIFAVEIQYLSTMAGVPICRPFTTLHAVLPQWLSLLISIYFLMNECKGSSILNLLVLQNYTCQGPRDAALQILHGQ